MKRMAVNTRSTFALQPGDLETITTQGGFEGRPVLMEIHCHHGFSSDEPQEPHESLTVTYEYTLREPIRGLLTPDRTEGYEDHSYHGYAGMPDWAQVLMREHAPDWWKEWHRRT